MGRRLSYLGVGIIAMLAFAVPAVGAPPTLLQALVNRALAIANRAEETASRALDSSHNIGQKDILPNAVHSEHIARAAVDSRAIGPSAIGPGEIAAGAVTAEKIADGSVTGAKIAEGAITASNLAVGTLPATVPQFSLGDGAVTTAKLADNSVTSAKIADGTITAADIAGGVVPSSTSVADGSVTTAKIADAAVTSAKIADGSITDADLASGISGTKINGVVLTSPASTQTIAYGGAAAQTILKMAASPTASPFAIQDSSGANLFTVGTNGRITTASVDSGSIVDASIALGDLGTNSVDGSKVVDGSIHAADLNADAIAAASGGSLLLTPSTTQTVAYGAAGVQTILKMAASPSSSPFTIQNSSGTDLFTVGTSGVVSTASVADASISGTLSYAKLNLAGSVANGDLAGGINDSKLSQITSANKVADSALSSNVDLLNAAQTVSGAKTFTAAALFQNAADSTAAFQIKRQGGTALLVADTTNSTVTITGLSGSGANLTSLSAGNVSSGTLNDLRLSSNVDLLDAAQTVSGAKTFTGNVTIGTGGTPIVKHLSFTGSLNILSVAGGSCGNTTLASLTGVTTGDTVTATPTVPAGGADGIETTTLSWNAYVSTTDSGANGVITLRACNVNAVTAADPGAQTWRFDVWKH